MDHIYNESGEVSSEQEKEINELVKQAIAAADLIMKNQEDWGKETDENEKNRLFEEARLLTQNYTKLLDQIVDKRSKNTPLINKIIG